MSEDLEIIIRDERKLIESDLCTFCKNCRETTLHLFWNCNITQLFIYRVKAFIKQHLKYDDMIDLKSFFFCVNDQAAVNIILIVAKWCIYIAKLNESKPNILVFTNKVSEIYKTEKYIAIKNKKIQDFTSKWGIQF